MRHTPLFTTFRLLAACGLLCAAAPVLAQTPSPLGEWQYSAGQILRMRFDPNPPKWATEQSPGASSKNPGGALVPHSV